MRVPQLLSGFRWLAFVFAAVLVVFAAYLAQSAVINITVSTATFTAMVSLVGLGLATFFWAIDRRDRLNADAASAQRELARETRYRTSRRADVAARLELELDEIEAGPGYKRHDIWVVNHGPGVASNLELSIDTISSSDLGSLPPTSDTWDNPAVAAKTKHLGPFPRHALGIGAQNQLAIYHDSGDPVTGGSKLPIVSADLVGCGMVRVRIDSQDVDGVANPTALFQLQRAGGFYDEGYGGKRWFETWIIGR